MRNSITISHLYFCISKSSCKPLAPNSIGSLVCFSQLPCYYFLLAFFSWAIKVVGSRCRHLQDLRLLLKENLISGLYAPEHTQRCIGCYITILRKYDKQNAIQHIRRCISKKEFRGNILNKRAGIWNLCTRGVEWSGMQVYGSLGFIGQATWYLGLMIRHSELKFHHNSQGNFTIK